MRKLIVSALAAAAVLGAASVASAQFIPYPICHQFWSGFIWVYICY